MKKYALFLSLFIFSIVAYCQENSGLKEFYKLNWPDSSQWKIAGTQDDGGMLLVEMIHANENVDNWTEMGTMMTLKGMRKIPIDTAMKLMFRSSQQEAIEPHLTVIEKDTKAKYPWILFAIEASKFKSDAKPESQLWYVIQGKDALYTNFVAIKKGKLPPDFIKKWSLFLKAGKIVYK